MAISAHELPESRICLRRCSSAGVHGVFVRLFLVGGVGTAPGSVGCANLMGVPVELVPAEDVVLASGAPAGMVGGGTADTVPVAAVVVGMGGGMIGEAEDAGAGAPAGCAATGFGRLRERWATGVDACADMPVAAAAAGGCCCEAAWDCWACWTC